MFSQLLIKSQSADQANEFRQELQSALVRTGVREAEFGPYAIPADYPDFLEALDRYYVRVHQNKLGRDELDRLIGQLSQKIWGDAKAVCRIS